MGYYNNKPTSIFFFILCYMFTDPCHMVITNSYESSFETIHANMLHFSLQVIGLSNVSIAGDEFEVVASLDIAREKAEARAELLWDERISAKAGDGKVTLSSLASAGSVGKLSGLDLHQLNIIMKVDLQVCEFALFYLIHIKAILKMFYFFTILSSVEIKFCWQICDIDFYILLAFTLVMHGNAFQI